MAPKTDFPPVRACLFDMDGLLLDTEDIYTACINTVLERYGRPNLPWHIKARLQGRPLPEANKIFMAWAQLPIDAPTFLQQNSLLQAERFPSAQPLPGVPALLDTLAHHTAAGPAGPVHLALATSSQAANFRRKTDHLQDLFAVFAPERRILGDDPRIPAGRGKPLPDIYLLALATVNASRPAGTPPILPHECLVFEDSVPGVEAGRRAGMRVIWCPHPGLKAEYAGREPQVLAGTTGEAEAQIAAAAAAAAAASTDIAQPLPPAGAEDDGWAEYLPTLENFPYARYGIVVTPAADTA